MEFVFLSAHKVEGIAHASDAPDLLLFEGKDPWTRVILTRHLSKYWGILDRQAALVGMLARGRLGGLRPGDVPEGLEAEVHMVRFQREKLFGGQGIIVIEIRGELNAEIRNPQQFGDFLFCMEAYDKDALEQQVQDRVASVLAAVRIGAGQSYETERIWTGSYLLTEEGTVVHSVSIKGSPANMYASSPLKAEQIARIQEDLGLILRVPDLARVVRLFAYALDRGTDDLRTFISAWAALEVLIAKVSPQYEAMAAKVKRVSDPRDRYSLADRFAILAAYLGEGSEDDDVKAFRAIQDVRQGLHRGDILDRDLPNRQLQGLLDKYLRNHLRRSAP